MRYLNAPNTAFGEDRRTYKVGTNGVTSNQTVFNVSYDNGRVEAYLNGVRLYPGDDFTKSSSGIGTNIALASAIGASNVLEIVGYQGINSGNALVEDNFVVGTGSTGSGGSYTNSTTEFPVTSSVGDTVSVWRNGVKLVPTTDYTVSVSAQTVTLGSAANSADEITVQVVGGAIHNNGLTVNSGSNSFFLPTTRGTDGQVLTRDDSAGTGGTAWKETALSPTITSIKYSEQTSGTFVENSGQTATEASASTPELCQISGTNFDNSMTISVGGTSAGSVVINSTTQATFTPPSKTAGSYTLTVTNPSGLTASISISYDADPAWVTGANADLGDFVDGSITGTNGPQIIASEDGSNLTTGYKQVTSNSDNTVITSGIAGLTIGDNGYLTGTLAGTDGATNNFYAIAIDNEGQQSAIRQFHFISYDYAGSGGTVIEPASYTGDFRSHTFLSGTTTFTLYKATTVDILIVAGGGGGAGYSGGGGGAGGVRALSSQSLNAGTYTITVGIGGTGSTHNETNGTATGGTSGGNSSVVQASGTGSYSQSATGGGVGGSFVPLGNTGQVPTTGGSGGGGGPYYPATGAVDGATGDAGNYTPDEGNAGGLGRHVSGSSVAGGGGGGAGGAGGDGSGTTGGQGGIGITNNWRDGSSNATLGFNKFGGGGIGDGNGTPPSNLGWGGGSGGGGDGTDNTGGGGGGNTYTVNTKGGDGGSGIVVIRYAI